MIAKRFSHPPLIAAVLVALAVKLLAAPDSFAASRFEPHLAGFWDRWLADVEPLITDDERAAFARLEEDRERERFMARFFVARGAGTLERFGDNLEAARQLRSQAPERTQAALLAGKPASIETFGGCDDRLRSLEVWRWESWHLARQRSFGARPPASEAGQNDPDRGKDRGSDGDNRESAVVVFVQHSSYDPRSYRTWTPGDLAALAFGPTLATDLDSLLDRAELARCFDREQQSRLRGALRQAIDLDGLEHLVPWPQPAAEPPLDPRRDASARLEISYPGGLGRHTAMLGRVTVDPQRLHELSPGQILDRLTITGDVFAGRRLEDSFELVHHVAGAAPLDEPVTIRFYRRLRPGPHTLHLRIADRDGLALLHETRALEVPEINEPAPAPVGRGSSWERLTRSELVMLETLPSVEILPAPAAAAARSRIYAVTTGGPIAAVEFRVDGIPVEVDREPPFSVEVTVGGAGSEVEAIALDPAGQPIARHRRRIDREPRAFAIRFEDEPVEGAVPVIVNVPENRQLLRVECFHNRARTRVMVVAPFSCPLPDHLKRGFDYLRVAATLDDGPLGSGTAVEDVRYLGDEAAEQIDVRLVELRVSVLDGRGRPAQGLGIDDFRIAFRTAAGVQRLPVIRVDSQRDLPLNVGLLMDISSSMGRSVRVAAASAQRFYRDILAPGDRASLIAFNHDLRLLAPFTDDVELLSHAAGGLRAWGATRLNDAIVYALFQFTGVADRRALIVLSDGADVDSDFPFAQVLDAAIRAGVAVYPVSLGAPDRLPADQTKDQLEELARVTGGRAFAVGSIDELDTVYQQIEDELRSQYLLVFRPAESLLDVRQVDVEVLGEGLVIRNRRGR